MTRKKRSGSGGGDGTTTPRSTSKKKRDQHADDDAVDTSTSSQKKTKRAKTPSRGAHHLIATSDRAGDESMLTGNNMDIDEKFDVMDQVLTFLELTNNSAGGGGGQSKSSNIYGDAYARLLAGSSGDSGSNCEKKEKEERLRSTIAGLVAYLSSSGDEANDPKGEGRSNVSSSRLSKDDIVKLLLPWAVKSVLRRASSSSSVSSQNDVECALEWRTMSSCLDIMMPATASSASSIDASIQSTVLNQSNLNKLVPLAAKLAMSDSVADACESAVLEQATSAASCFRALALVYRPTMDSACNDLLILVDGLSSKLQEKEDRGDDANKRVEDKMNASFRFDFQAKVIEYVVSLIWRLQQSGAANPKKIFALLSSSSTLSALGRFYTTSGLSSVQDLVKNILWRGLFHASHHIEGFRSMKLDVGSLIDTKAQDASENNKSDDKKKRNVACYQETLLNSIRETILDVNVGVVGVAAIVPLLVEGFVYETRKWRDRDTRSVGIAFGGGGAGRSSAKANMTALQFKFWCTLLAPVIAKVQRYNEEKSRSSNGVQRAILRCIQVSLSVLLKNDLYLPSYPDPDQRNFGYLQTISSRLLRFAEMSMAYEDDEGFSSQQEICEILLSLQALLQANHHILHNDLYRLVLLTAKCLPEILDGSDTSDSDTPRHQQLGADLVCTSIETYANLRQLEHLFSALLLQKSAQSESSEALLLLERIIEDSRIVGEMSKAILSIPQGQVRPIWSLFDESVSKITKNAVDDESGEVNGLRYVIGAFILFLRSIRIDKNSAAEIKMLCERSVDASIPALVSESIGGESDKEELDPTAIAGMSPNAVHGVSLCGWLIDAHTRCSFWLDLNFDDVAGSSLLSGKSRQSTAMLKLLLHAANAQKATGDNNLFRNHSLQTSLQHLACHRIEQLHSMIHQKEQLENVASQLGEDDGSKGSAALIAEARLLVDFAVRTADSCGRKEMGNELSSTVFRKGANWAVLARTLSLWAPYSESRHVDCFLSWVLSSFVLPDDSISIKSRRDRDIAKALVADASFYENGEVSSQLLGVTITTAIASARNFINSKSGSGSGDSTRKSARKNMKRKRSKSVDSGSASRAEALLHVPSDPSFQALTTQSLTEAYHAFVDEDCAVRSISPDSFAEGGDLGRALRLLRFANGLPTDLIARTCKPLHVDLLLRLDAYVQGLFHSSAGLDAEVLQQLLSLGSACKLALERTIVAAAYPIRADSDNPLSSAESQKAILEATHKSYVVAGKSHNKSFAKFSLHAGRLIELLLSNGLLDYRNDSSLIEGFAEATDVIVSREDGPDEADAEFIANTLFLRSITRGLASTESGALRSRNPANRMRACDLFFPLAFFEGGFWKILVDFIANYDAEEQGQRNLSAVSEAMLLVSDLIRYASSLPSKAYGPIEPLLLKALERVFWSIFERAFRSDIDVSNARPLRSSLYYLVASAPGLCCKLASLDAPILTLNMIQNHFKISSGDPDSLLDSAFCGIVQYSDIQQTRSLLAALVNGLRSNAWDTRSLDIASSVHAYHLILLSTKGQHQKAEVSSVARYFSSVSQQLLFADAPSKEESSGLNDRCAQIGTTFLTTLIGKKDVLLFSSQDAATLLSRVINLLPPVPKTTQCGTKDGKCLVSCDMYRECCAVVSALIKYYPKQLYGCAPSVISVFHSLLAQATEAAGDDIVLMALEFGKLAELLTTHNEVFKKHVLGLILFFVDSLVAGMSATTKKTLLPAIFSLLGMLSKYELHQLGVTMTPSSKSLFRSIFRDFQKMQYKGQY